MSFIIKINSYYNDEGIEIQEEELVSGEIPKGRPQYTAMVNVQVNTPDGPFAQPISAKYHAIGVEDAFKKARGELQKEIKKFEQKLQKEVKEAKEESLAPKIITSSDT